MFKLKINNITVQNTISSNIENPTALKTSSLNSQDTLQRSGGACLYTAMFQKSSFLKILSDLNLDVLHWVYLLSGISLKKKRKENKANVLLTYKISKQINPPIRLL